MPNTDADDPKRAKLRKENELPMVTKSKIDAVDPNLLNPKILADEPARATARTEMELPNDKKSNTENELPKRAHP